MKTVNDAEIEAAYKTAKYGHWKKLLGEWEQTPEVARACSRYQRTGSGWTFLHQAAYWANEAACRELIRLGADPCAITRDEQSPSNVAERRNYSDLARLLQRASNGAGVLWDAPKDPALLPSSSLWDEARERRAARTMRVAYADDVIRIPARSRYYVDSFERVLIGWHGSFNPPRGMDAESMVRGIE